MRCFNTASGMPCANFKGATVGEQQECFNTASGMPCANEPTIVMSLTCRSFNTASGMPCANPVPRKPWYQWAEKVVCGAKSILSYTDAKKAVGNTVKPYPHWCGANHPSVSIVS